MQARIAQLGLVVLGLAAPCRGQSAAAPQEPVTVTLKDGGTLIGTIVREDDAGLTLRTASGLELQLPREAVAAVRRGESYSKPSDPNDTRLMFATTGRPLKKGDGYFSDH